MANDFDPASVLREQPPVPLQGADIIVMADAAPEIALDPISGEPILENADGSVTVDIGVPGFGQDMDGAKEHGANLAAFIDESMLGTIAEDLLQGIESDLQSRTQWIENRKKGIGLLALDIQDPNGGGDATAVEGQSTVKSPMLLEAVLRFQANAIAELLPAAGPVKVRNDTPVQVMPSPPMVPPQAPPMPQPGMPPGMPGQPPIAPMMPPMGHNGGPSLQPNPDLQAEALEKDMNHFLTVIAKEYYPDTRRGLFYTGFGGSTFKKVYRCPLRRRPASDNVDADDLIVDDAEVALQNCGRVTHRIMMRQSVLKRMQLAKQYRITDIGPPTESDQLQVDAKEAEVMGFNNASTLPADYKHTIYECYCELDIPGFEHRAATEDGDEDIEGEITGLSIPYRVTIEATSRKILEIRRNWREGDEFYIARMPFVKYPFIEGLGFYGIGLLQILGNSTMAVTMAWRLALDSAMFASFPGFLYSDGSARQDTNIFRVPPGGGVKINTGGMPINQAVMELPYRDASVGLMSMIDKVEGATKAVGGIAEIAVGEGRQDAPVGTTLALLDQATKIVAAVHKGLHSAQSEEFGLLRDLFVEDPQAMIRGNRRPAKQWQVEELRAALENYNLVPAADPNTPSHMHRIMTAQAMIQLATMAPDMYDIKEVHSRALKIMGESDPDALFKPPAPPQQAPMDPKLMAAMMNNDVKMKIAVMNNDAKAQERISKEKLALMEVWQEQYKLETERMETAGDIAIHAAAAPIVEGFLAQPMPEIPMPQMLNPMAPPMPGMGPQLPGLPPGMIQN